MAGTVEALVQFFAGETGGDTSCDSVTDWAGDVTPVLDTDIFIQGTGSLSAKTSKLVVQHVWFDISGTVDLANKALYSWWFTLEIAKIGTKAEGGIRLRVESSATDWAEWYLAGRDTWAGGWMCFPLFTGSTPDETSGSVDFTIINRIAVGWYTNAAPKIYPNIFWDAIRYGTGLRIKSGTEADPGTFNDILTAEEATANRWGVLEQYGGVFYIAGKLYFGSTTGGEATYFKDTSQVVVFKDIPFGTFYEMIVEGNATATTKVFFGEKVGDKGVSGCMFRSAGASKFKFTATDTNITELGVYGCSFYDADTISLPPYSATREVVSSNFEACAEVLADTCTVQYCNFISADDRGIRISSTSHNITDSNFINCGHGVNVSVDGTVSITFDALIFSGNTYDIEKSSPTGDLTVNCVNGSNPSTYEITGGGTVTIVNTVYLTVWVEDEDGNPIQYAQTAIYDSAWTELMNKDTDAAGKAQETYNYVGDEPITVRIRKSSPSATRYFPYETSGTITSGGYTLTAVLIKDEIAA